MNNLNNLLERMNNNGGNSNTTNKEDKKMNVLDLLNNKKVNETKKEVTVNDLKNAITLNAMAERLATRAALRVESESSEVLDKAIENNTTKLGKKTVAANKVLAAGKKRLSVKGVVNLMNIIYDKSEEDAKNKKVSNILYIQQSNSELTRGYEKVSPLVNRHAFVGNTIVDASILTKNIQDEIVLLTIAKGDEISEKMYKLYIVEDKEVYVSIDGGKLYELISEKECDVAAIADKNVKVYEGLLYSPSQEKKSTITCLKVYDGAFSAITDDAIAAGEERVYQILNKITNGMMAILKKKGELTFKKAVKANARLSQIMSPSEDVGTCTSYALILDDEIMNFTDGGGLYNALSMNRWLKQKYYGNFPLPVEASMGSIKQIRPLGCKKAAVGTDTDMIDITLNKFKVVILERTSIDAYTQEQLELTFDGKLSIYSAVNLKLAAGKIIVVPAEGKNYEYACDENLKKDIMDSFSGNGRFNVVDGVLRLVTCVLIVDDVNNTTPDFVTDLNCFKAAVDFTSPAKFIMLDESKGIDGLGRLSIQMNLTTLLAEKPGLEYLEKVMLHNREKSFNDFMNVKDKTPRIEEFNDFYLGNVLGSVAGNFVMNHDVAAFKSMADQWMKGQLSSIHNVNALVDNSGYVRLMTDWGKLIVGNNLFDIDECVSPDAEKAYENILLEKAAAVIDAQPSEDKNRITKKVLSKAQAIDAIMKFTSDEVTLELAKEYLAFKNDPFYIVAFRSPKMGLAEFGRFRVMFKKDREARIKERVKDERVAKILLKHLNTLKPGTFLLPAFEKLKELLGGADFDFDGITLICDQGFVSLLKDIKPRVVSVKKSSEEGKDTYKVGTFGDSFNMFYTQIFNNEMGIGEITNMNDLLCLLLFVDTDTVRRLFRKAFKPENLKALVPYVSPLFEIAEGEKKGITEVRTSDVDNIIARIKKASLSTRKEIDTVIRDLNDVLRYYQESTIDASKSGDKIEVMFNLLTDCQLLCLKDKAHIYIDWENNKVVDDVVRKSTSAWKMKEGSRAGEDAFIINDEFHKIMVKAYDLVIAKAKLLVEHAATIKLNKEHIEFLTNAKKKYPQYEESLLNIAYQYNSLNAIRLSKVRLLQDKKGKINKTIRKICIPGISDEYNKGIEGLTNMIRTMMKDVSPVDRAALLKYVAIHTKDGIDANGGNSICHTLLPEEYLLMVMAMDSTANKFARSKVIGAGRYNEGDTATVKLGVSVEENTNVPSFVGNKDLEGTYTIEKDENGVAYLVQPIESLIDIKMPEKRMVVVRLFPNVTGQYKNLIAKLEEEKPKAIKVTTWKPGGAKDKVSIIVDGIIKPLSKFQAPDGKSPLGKLLDGFVGNVVSFTYNKTEFENEFGDVSSRYNILVVAEEAEVEYKRVNPLDALKGNTNNATQSTTTGAPSAPASLADLLKGVKKNKPVIATTPVVTTTSNDNKVVVATDEQLDAAYGGFGGHEDEDLLNLFKAVRKSK